MSKSPDLRGRRVRMAAADHPHANQVGLVIDQVPCGLCAGCEYEDLIVRLDDGTETRVYEPEVDLMDEEPV